MSLRIPSAHRVIGALLLVLLSAPGCSLLDSGGGYHVTAYFPRAVALYPDSIVKVMGVDAGTVDAVVTEGNRVRVEMTVHDEVPLPEDVQAAIRPLTLIGERNVVLFPAWKPGDDKARDGTVIPLERTEIPVEPDEALRAFAELARALDPDAVAELVTSGARALEGHGAEINDALGEVSELGGLLASVDTQLLDAAENLHVLATTLNEREQQFGSVVRSLSDATEVLATEREGIARFLSAIVRLTDAGSSLLDVYEDDLPRDIGRLVELVFLLEDNIGSLEQTMAAFPATQKLLGDAYNPETHALDLGLPIQHALQNQIDTLFDFDNDGEPDIELPCIVVQPC